MKNTKRTFHILHKGEEYQHDHYTNPFAFSSFEQAKFVLDFETTMSLQRGEEVAEYAAIVSIIGGDPNSMRLEYSFTAPIPF